MHEGPSPVRYLLRLGVGLWTVLIGAVVLIAVVWVILVGTSPGSFF